MQPQTDVSDTVAAALAGGQIEPDELARRILAFQTAMRSEPIPFPSDARVQLAIEFLRIASSGESTRVQIPPWGIVAATEVVVAAMLQRAVRPEAGDVGLVIPS